MRFGESEITSITEAIFGTALELPITPAAGPPASPGTGLAGAVRITGHWHGTVAVWLPPELARRVAAVMFGLAPDAVTDTEERDAVGELANMVAGNFKGMLPSPSQLSLPDVAAGSWQGEDALVVGDVWLACGDAAFRVFLAEADTRDAEDGRRSPRTPAPLAVEVKGAAATVRARAVDVGPTGIRLQTEERLPLGERCEVRAWVRDAFEPVFQGSGVVARWTQDGFAVEFAELVGPDSYSNLYRLVHRQRRRADQVEA